MEKKDEENGASGLSLSDAGQKNGQENGASGSSSKRCLKEKGDEDVDTAKKPRAIIIPRSALRLPKPSRAQRVAKNVNRPTSVPDEIVSHTVWRWWSQYQVWQGRLKTTNKKTLFCGLCGLVCPGEKKIVKHFLAEHGREKYYKCDHCEKAFCLRANLKLHMDEVHCKWMDPGRWDWGPKEQQTVRNDTRGGGGKFIELRGEDSDEDDEEGGIRWGKWGGEDEDVGSEDEEDDSGSDSEDQKLDSDDESDHEYTEDLGEGSESKSESEPDSEGAREFDSDSE